MQQQTVTGGADTEPLKAVLKLPEGADNYIGTKAYYSCIIYETIVNEETGKQETQKSEFMSNTPTFLGRTKEK